MAETTANAVQIGGGHYKATDEMRARAAHVGLNAAPEPWDYSYVRQHDPLQATICKYVDRFRSKGGVQDLQKAAHVLQKLIEIETAKAELAAAEAAKPKGRRG